MFKHKILDKYCSKSFDLLSQQLCSTTLASMDHTMIAQPPLNTSVHFPIQLPRKDSIIY